MSGLPSRLAPVRPTSSTNKTSISSTRNNYRDGKSKTTRCLKIIILGGVNAGKTW